MYMLQPEGPCSTLALFVIIAVFLYKYCIRIHRYMLICFELVSSLCLFILETTYNMYYYPITDIGGSQHGCHLPHWNKYSEVWCILFWVLSFMDGCNFHIHIYSHTFEMLIQSKLKRSNEIGICLPQSFDDHWCVSLYAIK